MSKNGQVVPLILLLLVTVACQQQDDSRSAEKLQKTTKGTMPDDLNDSYFRDYYQNEYDERELTHVEMNKAIEVKYDIVRVVDNSMDWHELDREIGEKLLELAKSIRHEKRNLVEGEMLVFPHEFEVHYVQDEKLLLRIDIPFETNVYSMWIFRHQFIIQQEVQVSDFRKIRNELKRATGKE